MTMNLIEKCRGWFLWQASEFGKSIVLWHLLQPKILKVEVGRRKKKKKVQNTVLLENTKEKNESEWWAPYWSLHTCVNNRSF